MIYFVNWHHCHIKEATKRLSSPSTLRFNNFSSTSENSFSSSLKSQAISRFDFSDAEQKIRSTLYFQTTPKMWATEQWQCWGAATHDSRADSQKPIRPFTLNHNTRSHFYGTLDRNVVVFSPRLPPHSFRQFTTTTTKVYVCTYDEFSSMLYNLFCVCRIPIFSACCC